MIMFQELRGTPRQVRPDTMLRVQRNESPFLADLNGGEETEVVCPVAVWQCRSTVRLQVRIFGTNHGFGLITP
eukprot:761241-Hanusia_phi.AAC.1